MAYLPKDLIKKAEKLSEEIEKIRNKKNDKRSPVAKVAQKYGLDRSTIQNTIKLLELDIQIQNMVSSGDLAQRNALAILKAPKQLQLKLAEEAVLKGWNRDSIQKRINSSVTPIEQLINQKNEKSEKDPNIIKSLDMISEKLKNPIKMLLNEENEGGVVIIDIYYTHLFAILFGDPSLELYKVKAVIEGKIDTRKETKQRGQIKLFFDDRVQKFSIIKMLLASAIRYERLGL